MKILSADVTGKLNQGLVELYRNVDTQARVLGVGYLVIGAMARDLVLVHGFGARIERGTKDVDFAIDVADWESFNTLKMSLLELAFTQDPRIPHRLHFEGSDNLPWEIDIVPFGGIQDAEANITWPPENERIMSVLGFREAHEHAIKAKIQAEPEVSIPVASPAGISLLKLVAWLDRRADIRPKDATDLRYLMETYTKIPEIFDAVYEENCMEAQDWDEIRASAMKLGRDVAAIARAETMDYLASRLRADESLREALVRDMAGRSEQALTACTALVGILLAELFR